MDKICDNCIFCYKPTSIKDFFDKTLTPPNLNKWGINVFKHEFWLCGSPDVSKTDHTNNSLIYEICEKINKRGVCEHFRISTAEDIVPSSITIEATEPIPEKIKVGTSITLTSTIIPAIIPAVTKEVTVEKEVPVTDSEGNPLYDENNDPITQIVEVTETVIVVPEHENDQNIHYSYQWYKNGRKLFKETKSSITFETTSEEVDTYTCMLLQDIAYNGDGGQKHAEVLSNPVELNVVEPTVNKITLAVKTGSVSVVLPMPFKPSDYNYPLVGSWAEDWTIKSAETSSEDLELTSEVLENLMVLSSSDVVAAVTNTVELASTKEGASGEVTLYWETIE